MRKRNPFFVFPSADSITPSVTDQQHQTLWNMMEEKKINKALDYCLLVNQDDLEGDCTEGKKTEDGGPAFGLLLWKNQFLCRIT